VRNRRRCRAARVISDGEQLMDLHARFSAQSIAQLVRKFVEIMPRLRAQLFVQFAISSTSF
jgi:hypothetical protein